MYDAWVDWNQRIISYFFRPEQELEEVRLAVSHDVLDEIGVDIGGHGGFIRTVRLGPEWQQHVGPGILRRARPLSDAWRQPHRRTLFRQPDMQGDAPPHLPYLCLFCLAWAERPDSLDLGANAFYGVLSEHFPGHGLDAQNMGQMNCLWDDLATWANILRKKQFGLFHPGVIGFANVGKPRYQVLLTSRNVAKLPRFYFDAGFSPGQLVSSDEIARAIESLHAHHWLRSLLELQHNRQFVLERVLADWNSRGEDELDIRDPIADSDSTTFPGNRQIHRKLVRLRLMLRPTLDGRAWSCLVSCWGPFDEGLISIRINDADECSAAISEWATGPLSRCNTEIDATELLNTAEPILKGSYQDVEGRTSPVNVSWIPKSVRLFRWDDCKRLVEELLLPNADYIYVLVASDLMANWQAWLGGLPDNAEALECPTLGLPENCGLYYLKGLEYISETHRSEFPQVLQRRKTALHFKGGTHVRRAGFAGRVYWHCDPPTVVLDASPSATVNVNGSPVLTETQDRGPLDRREVTRHITLEPSYGCHVQRVQLLDHGEVVEEKLVRYSIDAGENTSGNFYIDWMGRPTSSGLQGMQLIVESQSEADDFQYAECKLDDGLGHNPNTFDQLALDILSLISQHGRVSYARFRDFARRQARQRGLPEQRLTVGVRSGWILGHFEIQSDAYGRWTYVHSTPLVIYALPWKCRGYSYAVVSGTFGFEELSRIRLAAGTRRVNFEARSQHVDLVPPRLLLFTKDIDDIAAVCRDVGATFLADPPSWRILKWIGDLKGWQESLDRFDGAAPTEEQFSLMPFQFTPSNEIVSGKWLVAYEDPETGVHRRFAIRYKDNSGNQQHAFVRDDSWARWFAYKEYLQCFAGIAMKPPVLYRAKLSLVVVPAQMRFPLSIARAFASCSGLAPFFLDREELFLSQSLSLLPKPYDGKCLSYPLVPCAVASTAITKVGGEMVSYQGL